MRSLDSLTFTVRSISSSKLRSLGLLLGLMLPVALISGVGTSVDNTELNRLAEELEVCVPDLTLSPSDVEGDPGVLFEDLVECSGQLEDESLVASAIPVVEFLLIVSLAEDEAGDAKEVEGAEGDVTSIRLLGLPASLDPGDASLIGIDDYTDPGEGCLIDVDTANRMGLSRTSVIALSAGTGGAGEMTDRLVMHVEGIVDLDDQVRHPVARFRACFPSLYYGSPTVIIPIDLLPGAMELLGVQIQNHDFSHHPPGLEIPPSARVLLFLDREQLLRTQGAESVRRKITELGSAITSRSHIDLSIENHAVDALGEVERDSHGMREEFVAVSLPLLGLSIYIGLVSGESILAMRRREITLLRVRGLRPRSTFELLLLEIVLIGAAASCLGILAGWGTSRLFAPAVSVSSIQGIGAGAVSPENGWASPPSLETTLIALCAGLAVAVAPAIAWARRATKIRPHPGGRGSAVFEGVGDQEAMGDYLGEKTDMMLLCLAAGSIVSGIVVRSGAGFHLTGIWSMIIQTVAPALYALQPLVPFFLIIGLTRLVVRRDSSIRAATKLLSPLSSGLGHVVQKTQASVRSQNWRACFVVGLALGFGGLITVSMASVARYRVDVAPIITGGDISITDLYSNEVDTVSDYLLGRGADLSVSIEVVSFFSEGCFYVIDTENYPLDPRIKPGLRDEVERSLSALRETEMGALIGGHTTSPGEEVKMRYYAGNLLNYTTLTSAGQYRVMPGLGGNWLGNYKSTIVSEETYQELQERIPQLRTHPHKRYLMVANLPEGTDLAEIREETMALLPDHLWHEGDVEIITEASPISTRRGISLFVRTEIHYLLLASLLGVTMIIVSLLSHARALSWNLAARGLRRRRRFLLVSALGLSPIILGLAVGTATGILAGYLWALQSANPQIPVTPIPVLGFDFLLVLSLSVSAFIGVAMATSYLHIKWEGSIIQTVDPWQRSGD